MPELAEPLSRDARAWGRLETIVRMAAQRARLESDFRAEIAAFATEDVPFGMRSFVCDELGPALAESPGTANRLIELSQMYVAHPAAMARVGLPLTEGGWSMRHADALLFSICGLGLSEHVQQEVVELVTAHPDARTPYQVRKAAQAAVMVLDPEGAERRLAKARKDRMVGSDALSDGRGSFWASGTASQVAAVMASIDCLAGPKQPGDPRTLDQRRFDAFMDLICGRVVPGQWQALVVVSLDTLTGESEEPGEIAGLGLINATEARDLVAHADLRRAVVDHNGELVSIDSTLHRPDLPDAVRLDEPHPDHGVSLQREPEPLDTSPEQEPGEEDLTWLAQQTQLEAAVADVSSTLEAELTALLTAHSPSYRLLVGAEQSRPWTSIEIRGSQHGPSGPAVSPRGGPGDGSGDGSGDGPGDGPGEGPGDAPESPPNVSPEEDSSGDGPDGTPDESPDDDGPGQPAEPEPPSLDDQLWAEATLDREAQDALEPPPRYEREPWVPYLRRTEPESRWTSWTRLALTAALAKVTRSPLDPQPLTSTAYRLPPRMARFVKHRDITCSFPGCPRLAWSTENDHLLPWPQGRTSAHNIDCKCKHHHQAKTHGGYQTTRLPDGTIRWTTPLGHIYDRHPRPLLRGF